MFLDTVGPSEGAALAEENAIYRHGDQFAEYLGKGLSDNWSQVKYKLILIKPKL